MLLVFVSILIKVALKVIHTRMDADFAAVPTIFVTPGIQ